MSFIFGVGRPQKDLPIGLERFADQRAQLGLEEASTQATELGQSPETDSAELLEERFPKDDILGFPRCSHLSFLLVIGLSIHPLLPVFSKRRRPCICHII